MARNPNWTREELILALDLYFRDKNPPGDAPATLELVDVLRKYGTAIGRTTDGTYRNSNGVYLKLMNFRRFDPEYSVAGKVGMRRGGKLDEAVWNEFADDREALAQSAKALRSLLKNDDAVNQLRHALDAEDGDAGGKEGGFRYRLHRVYERDARLAARKRSVELDKHGRLACEVCGFDFAEKFGDLGAGYMEVHHRKPVAELEPGTKVKLSDLALLCANCHRMAHRGKKVLSVKQIASARS